MPEQGRLVLRASDGDTELGLLVSRGGHATRGRHGTVQCLLDLGLVQRLGADDMGGGAPRAAARPAAARPAPQRAPAPAPKASTGFDDMDDDIPF